MFSTMRRAACALTLLTALAWTLGSGAAYAQDKQPAKDAPAAGGQKAPGGGAAKKPASAEVKGNPNAKLEDLVGDWTVAIMIPNAPSLATLGVQKAPKGLTAMLKSQLGENKIDDIELVDGKHTMLYMMKAGEQEMDIEVGVAVTGDVFGGKVIVSGGAMEIDIKGAKVGTESEKALKDEIGKASSAGAAPDAPTLPVADAKGLLGDWVMTLDTPGGPATVVFNVKDVDGKTQAQLNLPPPMQSKTINDIKKTEEGWRLAFNFAMGQQEFKLAMDAKRVGEGLEGQIADDSNVFVMQFKGMTKKAAEAAGLPTAPTAPKRPQPGEAGAKPAEGAPKPAAAAEGQAAAPEGGPSKRPSRGDAKLTLAGKNVSISYGRPSTKGKGYQQMNAGVKDGFVWRMGANNATKLKTDADLKFGATTIKAGSYSLWARRVGEGWSLIFNSKADVWGTQYDKASDVAEVPLKTSKGASDVELMTIDLKEDAGKGLFTLSWGPSVGTTAFTVAQ